MLHRENIDMARLQHPGFWQEFHRKVESQVRSVTGVLTDLAEDTGQPYRFDGQVHLHEALNAAIEEVRPELERLGIEVGNMIPADLPALTVDPRRFRRLFPAILQEELANLSDGAVVRFEASAKPGPDGKPAEIELFVNDNGPGLPPEAVHSFVDPFQNPDPRMQQLSVALMASYFIVYHHGGNVRIGHTPDRGLALTVTLPIQPRPVDLRNESEDFLIRAMTNERLWERLLAGTY